MRRETKFLLGGIGIGLVAGVVLCAMALTLGRQAERTGEGPVGKTAADIELTDINPGSPTHGQRVRLSRVWEERGLLLNFMASWCGPCRKELPDLQALYASGEAPLVCLASSEMGPEGKDALLRLAESTGLTAPLLYAEGAVVEKIDAAYTHPSLPTTYVIDREGTVREVLGGARPVEAFRRAIQAHL